MLSFLGTACHARLSCTFREHYNLVRLRGAALWRTIAFSKHALKASAKIHQVPTGEARLSDQKETPLPHPPGCTRSNFVGKGCAADVTAAPPAACPHTVIEAFTLCRTSVLEDEPRSRGQRIRPRFGQDDVCKLTPDRSASCSLAARAAINRPGSRSSFPRATRLSTMREAVEETSPRTRSNMKHPTNTPFPVQYAQLPVYVLAVLLATFYRRPACRHSLRPRRPLTGIARVGQGGGGGQAGRYSRSRRSDLRPLHSAHRGNCDLGRLFLEVGSVTLVCRRLVFCRHLTHNSRVRGSGPKEAVEKPWSNLGNQWTAHLRMFDGLSLPGAPKHLATPAVNKSSDVRRVEKYGGSRPLLSPGAGDIL